jgi:hypothetical protein
MFVRKFQIALLLVLSVLLAVGAFAQTATTGSIEGKITQAGNPLPGVTVEIRSANLQGVRTDVTDAQGNFRFTLLPPGNYSLTSNLSGFNTVKQQNIAVGLNRTVTLDVTMSAAVSETIVVTGAAPVVDVTSAASGVNITSETMRGLPIARNFTSVSQIAPGVTTQAGNGQGNGQVTVYGSSGSENEYIIDGLNTTGVSHGLNVKNVNYDFIQETEVMTGGLPAEYGRMTGGAINAITKSGSNEFRGDVFGYKAGGSLYSNPKYQPSVPATSTTIGDISQQYDFGANLGGFILKDRLWFFGAYDRVKETDESIRIHTALSVPGFSLPVGGSIPTDITRDLFAAKLSLALTPNHLFNVSVLGDPSSSDGAQFAISGPPSTFTGTNKTGGNDYVGHYSGVFGTRWNVNGNIGRHKEKNELAGPGTTTSQLQDLTQVPNTRSGGFVGWDNSEYARDVAKLDISSFIGNHTIKFGGDQEKLKTVANRFYGGGDWVRKRCSVPLVNNTCAADKVYYTHETFLNDLAPGFNKSDSATWFASIANPLVVAPKTKNDSLYLQDSWKVLGNLTVNAGVRYETQKVGDRFGNWLIDLKNNWAPRFGAIWDPANNGRSKAYVNFGRFYESIPMDINIREFGGELGLDVNNLDPTPRNLTPDPRAPLFSATKAPYRLLGNTDAVPVDPNLKGQYLDEYMVGYDYELASNLAVGIKGTYRNLGRVIEDMLVPSTGNYLVANPGSGTGAEGGTINGDTVPVPKPTRRFKAFELHAQKRFSNNYQFFASYVWSRLTGNYDGTTQVSTGQLDPNINSAYDYADFEVNNAGGGLLSGDRTHMIKFYGSYTVPSGPVHGMELGLATHYYSGTPLTAMGYANSYRNNEYYLTPRGALGRGPADYEADVHLGYPVLLGRGRFNILLDVFNILNRQAVNQFDLRYNLNSDPICAGVPDAICNGDGGILNLPGGVKPSGQLTNPKATATNPDFLRAGTSFTGQRSIRLGARFSF